MPLDEDREKRVRDREANLLGNGSGKDTGDKGKKKRGDVELSEEGKPLRLYQYALVSHTSLADFELMVGEKWSAVAADLLNFSADTSDMDDAGDNPAYLVDVPCVIPISACVDEGG